MWHQSPTIDVPTDPLRLQSARGRHIAQQVVRQIALFYRRSTTRRALRELDAHLLDDVGIDRQEARREAAKRFWRA